MTYPVDSDTFRLHFTTPLGDVALQTLLDAAAEAISAWAGGYIVVSGDDTEVNEILTPRGRGSLLRLSRRATSISEIIEDTTTLAADDYELRSSGFMVRRLRDGTNPSWYGWRGRVYVTYVPASDAANRERVQIALVKLDLANQPGITSQTIGSWSESYNTGRSYAEQRDEILASLSGSAMGIW